MEALSGLDATFLYLETPHSPMHVGSLAVLEGSLEFEDFREVLAERIHLVKTFRQRLVEVPLSLDRPYWVGDPHFNLDWHLHHTALPKPGGWRQLRKLCARIFSQPLDRARPLWEFVFVEGLDQIPQVPPGSVALISKIHHAAIDGMSGADILGLLFDLSPQGREIPPPPFEPAPEAIPGDLELIARSLGHMARRPLKLPSILMETAKATAQAGALTRSSRLDLPTMPFTAPRTPINATISAQRVWNTALLELDRVKRLKRAVGCTLNDVVLAICAGALRTYLKENDALPRQPLVAMVPVSTRSEQQKNAMGNQVSAMLVQLATDIEDPVERLLALHKNASKGKTYQNATDANALLESAELVPFGLAGQAARLYSRSELATKHRPIFNCVITNVPGPQVPLYLAGHRLISLMGMAPILDGMGLIITVFSYNGVLSISPLSSPKVMPDLDRFALLLRESANTLEAEILARYPDAERTAGVTGETTADLNTVFNAMRTYLEANPDLKLPGDKVYRFAVTGDQAQEWLFDLNGESPVLTQDEGGDPPVCTLRIDTPHVVSMLKGELDGMAAFMQGKLKVEGDINEAIRFGKVLAAFPRETLGMG